MISSPLTDCKGITFMLDLALLGVTTASGSTQIGRALLEGIEYSVLA